MSEWDFLWDLSEQELKDAIATGGTADDWDYVEDQLRKKLKVKWEELKYLRDSKQISKEVFKKRKAALFSNDR